MKLKFLSLAVIAAAAIPATNVLAADHAGGPTIYGKINLSLELGSVDTAAVNGPVTSGESVWELRDNSTRLGIKGEEDLGGITGIYQYEFSNALSDGSGLNSNRASYLGLKGDFGTVIAGRFDTPFKMSQGKIDLFGDGRFDMFAILGGEERAANAIGYKSNNYGGVSFFGMLQPGEGGTDNVGGAVDGPADAISLAVHYKTDELYLAFGYDMNASWSFYGSSFNSFVPVPVGAATRTDAFRLTGIYSMDNMGFGLMYQSAEQADVATPVEQTALVMSAYMQMDQTKFNAQYAMSEHDQGAVSGMDYTQLTFGAEQMLSKRTTLYAAYQMKTLDRGGFSTNADELDTSYFAVGGIHSF